MAIGFLKAIPWKHVGLFVAGTIEVVSKVGEGTTGAHPLPCLLFLPMGKCAVLTVCYFRNKCYNECPAYIASFPQ